MKTGTVTVRLPLDKIELMQKMAAARGCTMSELVREPIEQWLEAKPAPAAKNDDALVKRLAELEKQVTGGQKKTEAILTAALGNTAGARYLANLAVAYCDDMISYLATNKPIDDRSKALRDAQRQADEDAVAEACIKQVLDGLR